MKKTQIDIKRQFCNDKVERAGNITTNSKIYSYIYSLTEDKSFDEIKELYDRLKPVYVSEKNKNEEVNGLAEAIEKELMEMTGVKYWISGSEACEITEWLKTALGE